MLKDDVAAVAVKLMFAALALAIATAALAGLKVNPALLGSTV